MYDQPETPEGANFWGYCRVSTEEQTAASPQVQEDMARKVCKQFDGVFRGAFHEVASGVKIRWHDRVKFKEALETMEKGDHLVVWRLDRIDRDVALLNALQSLVDRGIVLHVVQLVGGMQLPPLDTMWGKVIVMLLTILSQMQMDQLRESTKAGREWRKANGYVYGNRQIGKKRLTLPILTGQTNPLKIDVWDERECAQIREIVRRHDEGESLWAITEDFYFRNLMTANGKRWVSAYTNSKGPRKGRVTLGQGRIRRAYAMYKQLEEEAIRSGEPLDVLPFGDKRSPEEARRIRVEVNQEKE